MTEPRTAYHAGIWDTLLAAAAIRARPDADPMRQKSAAEALEAFSQAFRWGGLMNPETPPARP